MTPSLSSPTANGTAKPAVLMLDKITLATEVYDELAKGWTVIVRPSSLHEWGDGRSRRAPLARARAGVEALQSVEQRVGS